jgi:predicted RNase H-like nuclease
MSPPILAGVDGCPGGWIAVTESRGRLDARVYADWANLMQTVGHGVVIAVDIPIGLPANGARTCDLEARSYLGALRGSSVFPAPVRACLTPGSYELLSARHRRVDRRGLSKQAFNLLPKIREVDQYLLQHPRDRSRIREVHPEVSFATWNAAFFPAMIGPNSGPISDIQREQHRAEDQYDSQPRAQAPRHRPSSAASKLVATLQIRSELHQL